MIKPNCTFRIIGLTEEELDTSSEFLSSYQYRKGYLFNDPEKKILVVPLNNQSIDADLILELMSSIKSEFRHDFVISVYTDIDSFMVDVPREVLALFKCVGGELCFSYTYAAD